MAKLVASPALFRRLAMALALLAGLALGLDEEACAAWTLAHEGQGPTLAEQVDLYAVTDRDGPREAPGKRNDAAPNPCHVCGAVMPMPEVTVSAPVPAVVVPAPASVLEHRGLDPGGLLRPPRASVIA